MFSQFQTQSSARLALSTTIAQAYLELDVAQKTLRERQQTGDDVLIQVARTLEKSVRRTDFIGRLGGDEFVVLLASTWDRAIIETIMRKIISGIGQPISIDGGNFAMVGVSIGAAIFEGDITSRDDLIQRADEAMYRAKEGGRNTFRFSPARADLPIDTPAPVHWRGRIEAVWRIAGRRTIECAIPGGCA